MSCYCDYDNLPEFYTVTHPVARREHRCCECFGVIGKGETYQRYAGKWDGRLETYKTCQRCVDFEKHVTAHIPCFSRCSFGELIWDAVDCLRDYKHEASSLLFGAYRRVIQMRRNAKAVQQ